jgi:hypothetical protein
MFQPGTIPTPGTSIQGQLLRYMLSPEDSGGSLAIGGSAPTLPILSQTVTQCGIPAILPYDQVGLGVFVAGRVNGLNSPFSAPWPLSPLYLYTDIKGEKWQFTLLPDRVHGRQHFVGGIPSTVRNGEEILVYFNGAQLLEYSYSPDHSWQVSVVPTPNLLVEANPVATIAAGGVFVVSIPGGDSLLLCSRSLFTSKWRFTDLAALASVCGFDGDPSVVFFAGSLHVFVSAISQDRASLNPGSFELWDFVVDPVTLETYARSISVGLGGPGCGSNSAIVGTPSAVASKNGILVFARSADDRLLEFSTQDGRRWSEGLVSEIEIGGDPGSVLLTDESPLICAIDKTGRLLSFTREANVWQATRIAAGPNEVRRKPIPIATSAGVSVFDLKVAL